MSIDSRCTPSSNLASYSYTMSIPTYYNHSSAAPSTCSPYSIKMQQGQIDNQDQNSENYSTKQHAVKQHVNRNESTTGGESMNIDERIRRALEPFQPKENYSMSKPSSYYQIHERPLGQLQQSISASSLGISQPYLAINFSSTSQAHQQGFHAENSNGINNYSATPRLNNHIGFFSEKPSSIAQSITLRGGMSSNENDQQKQQQIIRDRIEIQREQLRVQQQQQQQQQQQTELKGEFDRRKYTTPTNMERHQEQTIIRNQQQLLSTCSSSSSSNASRATSSVNLNEQIIESQLKYGVNSRGGIAAVVDTRIYPTTNESLQQPTTYQHRFRSESSEAHIARTSILTSRVKMAIDQASYASGSNNRKIGMANNLIGTDNHNNINNKNHGYLSTRSENEIVTLNPVVTRESLNKKPFFQEKYFGDSSSSPTVSVNLITGSNYTTTERVPFLNEQYLQLGSSYEHASAGYLSTHAVLQSQKEVMIPSSIIPVQNNSDLKFEGSSQNVGVLTNFLNLPKKRDTLKITDRNPVGHVKQARSSTGGSRIMGQTTITTTTSANSNGMKSSQEMKTSELFSTKYLRNYLKVPQHNSSHTSAEVIIPPKIVLNQLQKIPENPVDISNNQQDVLKTPIRFAQNLNDLVKKPFNSASKFDTPSLSGGTKGKGEADNQGLDGFVKVESEMCDYNDTTPKVYVVVHSPFGNNNKISEVPEEIQGELAQKAILVSSWIESSPVLSPKNEHSCDQENIRQGQEGILPVQFEGSNINSDNHADNQELFEENAVVEIEKCISAEIQYPCYDADEIKSNHDTVATELNGFSPISKRSSEQAEKYKMMSVSPINIGQNATQLEMERVKVKVQRILENQTLLMQENVELKKVIQGMQEIINAQAKEISRLRDHSNQDPQVIESAHFCEDPSE